MSSLGERECMRYVRWTKEERLMKWGNWRERRLIPQWRCFPASNSIIVIKATGWGRSYTQDWHVTAVLQLDVTRRGH